MRSKLMDVAGQIICICIGFLRDGMFLNGMFLSYWENVIVCEWTGWPKAPVFTALHFSYNSFLRRYAGLYDKIT